VSKNTKYYRKIKEEKSKVLYGIFIKTFHIYEYMEKVMEKTIKKIPIKLK